MRYNPAMPVEFTFLADRVDAVPIISRWYFGEWGYLAQDNSIAQTRDRIEDYMNRDEIPFILVATNDNDLVAAAQLKYREMADMFPDKEHWLGGVYVAANHRGQGYGSQIIEQIVKMAPRYGVETLYLQTEALDGGLYARLGWTPYAQATNRGLDVLVMERQLSG
jgi:GNAT superfamily N-acetyltransferase